MQSTTTTKNNRRTIIKSIGVIGYGSVKEITPINYKMVRAMRFHTCNVTEKIKKAPNSKKNKKVLFHPGSSLYLYSGVNVPMEHESVLIFKNGVGPYLKLWRRLMSSVNFTGTQELAVEVIWEARISNGNVPCYGVKFPGTEKLVWVAKEVLDVAPNNVSRPGASGDGDGDNDEPILDSTNTTETTKSSGYVWPVAIFPYFAAQAQAQIDNFLAGIPYIYGPTWLISPQ